MTLSDYNKAILLNGEEKYSSGLPMDLSRRSAAEKRKAVKNAILNACNSFGVDYVSMDNVNVAETRLVDRLYERPRIAKVLLSVSDAIRSHEGLIVTTGKIVGVSPRTRSSIKPH